MKPSLSVPKKWIFGKKNIWQLGGKFVNPNSKSAKFVVKSKTRWAFHKPRETSVGTTNLALAKANAYLNANHYMTIKGSVKIVRKR